MPMPRTSTTEARWTMRELKRLLSLRQILLTWSKRASGLEIALSTPRRPIVSITSWEDKPTPSLTLTREFECFFLIAVHPLTSTVFAGKCTCWGTSQLTIAFTSATRMSTFTPFPSLSRSSSIRQRSCEEIWRVQQKSCPRFLQSSAIELRASWRVKVSLFEPPVLINT